MGIKFQYYECVSCGKQIKRDKEFFMNCPMCNNIMKIKKIDISEEDNEQTKYRIVS
jgi:predicted RNA-binding Zn-ribbon protein involved in translation (DUF1610 family)